MTELFGLPPKCIADIRAVFRESPAVERVLIFGSRAMGNYKPGSDVDLALFGEHISYDDLLKIKSRLDDIPWVYMYDVVIYNKISNPAVQAHIDDFGLNFYEREDFGKEMKAEKWEKYRLGEIVKIKHGFAFKGEFFSDNPTNHILLSPGNFNIGGGFKNDKFKYYDGDYPKEYILKEGDIIVTMTDLSREGDTLGYSAKIPFSNGVKYLHNQRLGLLQFISDKVDSNFIYWLLRTRLYQQFIVGSATGSTVKHTSPTRIGEYEFFAPSLPTQRRIAAILTALDEKIELNRRMNETLESMAQAVWGEWFGKYVGGEEELPEGWKWGKLKEIYKTTSGGTPSRVRPEFYESGTISWVKSKELKEFFVIETEEQITEAALKNSSAKMLPPKSVLIAMYGATVGEVSILSRRASCNQAICAILPNSSYSFSYVFQFLKSEKENLKNLAVGAAQQNISQDLIQNMELLIPALSELKKYQNLAEPIFENILANLQQSRTLTSLRDILLPRLMRGRWKPDSANFHNT